MLNHTHMVFGAVAFVQIFYAAAAAGARCAGYPAITDASIAMYNFTVAA